MPEMLYATPAPADTAYVSRYGNTLPAYASLQYAATRPPHLPALPPPCCRSQEDPKRLAGMLPSSFRPLFPPRPEVCVCVCGGCVWWWRLPCKRLFSPPRLWCGHSPRHAVTTPAATLAARPRLPARRYIGVCAGVCAGVCVRCGVCVCRCVCIHCPTH